MTADPSPGLDRGATLPAQPRKIITSGFSFSGSSAIHDLLLDNGAAAFPGGEVRIFSSANSFSALTRDIKLHGSVRSDTIDNVLALLRGEARGAKPHFSRAVRSSVAGIRRCLGDFYDWRVDELAGELRRARRKRAKVIVAGRSFIDDVCNHFAGLTGASVVVFDQGVRPWALNRAVFYGSPVVFVCMRDIRDQMIERRRHSLDNAGFEEKLRSQVKKFQSQLSRPLSGGSVTAVWFEDLIMDASVRSRVLVAAGLGPRVHRGSHFNPVASRRNIGMYRARPDLGPASKLDDRLLHPGTQLQRRMLTTVSDYLRYGLSARSNRAGAYSKTKALREIPPATGN